MDSTLDYEEEMPEALEHLPPGAYDFFSLGSFHQASLASVRDAVACSMDALEKFGQGAHLCGFLAANPTSVHKVILIRDLVSFSHFIECQHAQLKWGEDALLLDLTKMATLLDYLEAVALFSGELHLININLSASEARHFLQLLQSSPTPPHSLHVYGYFYTPLQFENENLGSEILETVRKNGKITALTVAYAFDLDFVDVIAPSPSLQALTLMGVQVGVKFFEQISTHINSWASLKSLTFSHVQHTTKHLQHSREAYVRTASRRWQKAFSDLVQNDCSHLKHLALEGFSLIGAEDHFRDFINVLGRNSSLRSLSLAQCSHRSFLDRASLIASLVDAIHNSGLLCLELKGTPFAGDPAIEAQLGKNKARNRGILKSYGTVPATAVRLFICGDSYAGKTTLLATLLNVHKTNSRLGWFGGASSTKDKRTRGIEVHNLVREGIKVSAWDMAGQEEYHAFHDLIFPDMSAYGVPALFLFVWSPVDSKDDAIGEIKAANTFEASFRYWLKFIASNTRPSNVARKVIVVITRKDQMDFVYNCISTHLSILQNIFQPVIEIESVWEVDARSQSSVGDVASAIFECARSVLKDVQVCKICDELILHLATMGLSILAWEDFQRLCEEKFEIYEAKDQIAIAVTLHESGHLIYFRNMPFLVLDTHWFCCKIMGELIHFSGTSTSRAIPFSGFVQQDYLEKLLEQGVSSSAKVSAGHLVDLMEAMHLCCKVPGDVHSSVFIPSSLRESPTPSWRTSAKDESVNFYHAGRRLQCRDKLITFLTPGIFTVIQVAFNKAFDKIGADIVLYRNLISIYFNCIEIIVQFCKANGENVMDILVRSSLDKVDPSFTLKVMEEKVVRTIIRMCAEPIGNQGVELVQGVIRPECLVLPALSHEREDQYVLTEQLKENLKIQMQERPQQVTFWHTWRHNRYFRAGADSIKDLLGLKEYLDALKSYKSTLQEVAKELDATCEHEQILPQEDEQDACNFAELDVALASIADGKHDAKSIKGGLDEEGEDVDKICEGMAMSVWKELFARIDIIEMKVDDVAAMHKESYSLAMLQGDVLQQIQKNMEQFLFFESEKVVGRVPRLGFLTTEGIGLRRRFVTAFSKDLKSVRIELFCEDKDCPHKVEGQNGIHVTMLNEGAFKSALPHINGFLKLLTMIARVGAHAVAGLGSSVPDLSQIVTLLLDTPGIPDNLGSISGFTDANLSFNGWQQWLVHVLQQNGGMTEQNIFSKFKLRRALYKETSQVAWLCERHYISQTPFPLS